MPEKVLSEKINLNDNIQIEVDYSGNPNNVYFSIVLLYKLEIVATKSYSYKNFALKIWDLFNDFHSD